MSIDVFGRVSKDKKGAGARGPPGDGFQRTSNGDFDIRHKRLCNVATPQEDLDAVNLHSLKEIQHELESVNTMVKSLHAAFEKTLEEWKNNLDGVNQLAQRNAELIGQLDRYRYISSPASEMNNSLSSRT